MSHDADYLALKFRMDDLRQDLGQLVLNYDRAFREREQLSKLEGGASRLMNAAVAGCYAEFMDILTEVLKKDDARRNGEKMPAPKA